MKLKIEIENIKSIKAFDFEIPVEQGFHVIAGTNGIGKSSLMALLAGLCFLKLYVIKFIQ